MVSLLRVFSYLALVGMNAMKVSVCLRAEALQGFPQFRLGVSVILSLDMIMES
jgi:hypothetical protein